MWNTPPILRQWSNTAIYIHHIRFVLCVEYCKYVYDQLKDSTAHIKRNRFTFFFDIVLFLRKNRIACII